jgi:hypothetical protein
LSGGGGGGGGGGGKAISTETNAMFRQMNQHFFLLTTDICVTAYPTTLVLQTSSLNLGYHKVDSVPKTDVSTYLTRRHSPRPVHPREHRLSYRPTSWTTPYPPTS